MEFIVKENENHQLESIVNKNDKYKMNWVATGKKWGEMFLPDGITGRIERTVSTEGKITEKYIFVNNRNWEYFPQKEKLVLQYHFRIIIRLLKSVCESVVMHTSVVAKVRAILPGSEWEEKNQILGWF